MAILVLGGTPLQLALLAAVEALPALLFGLPAGVAADRFRRIRLMIAADLGRLLLLSTVPIAAAMGRLSVAHLVVVGLLTGTLGLSFDVAYRSILPSLVPRSRLTEANQRLGLSGSVSEVLGPGLSGFLVQVVSAPGAVMLDALSFGASAFFLLGIRTKEQSMTPAHRKPSIRRELHEGLNTVFRSPLLRAFALSACFSTFFGGFFAALYGLYVLRTLHISPAGLGITVAVGGVGDLLGVALAVRLAVRFGIGPAMLGASALATVLGLFTPLAGGPPLVALVMVAVAQFGDFAYGVNGVHEATLVQSLVPDRLLGRVNASMQYLSQVVFPLGIAVGGVIGQTLGVRTAIWIAVVGSMPGLLVLFFSPLREMHKVPTAMHHRSSPGAS